MSNVVHATTASWEALLKENEIVFVDFFATWCGPCKMLAPEIEKLADEYVGQVPVVKVDVDEEPELARRYNVMSIPTLFVFKNREAVATMMGFQPLQAMKNMIEKAK